MSRLPLIMPGILTRLDTQPKLLPAVSMRSLSILVAE